MRRPRVKVDSPREQSNLLDIAVSQAGIDLKSEDEAQEQDDSDKPVVKTEQVQSHHAYPSPFSQVGPFFEIT